MKKLNILAIFRLNIWATLILFAPVTPALADSCPPMPDPKISITNYFEQPSYDFDEDMATLRTISQKDPASVFHKETPVGLSVGEMNIGITIQTNMVVGNDGMVCARPKLLQLDTGFQHNTVYVTRELPRGTCGHEQILAHEMGHVAIDQQLLKEYQPRLARFAELAVQQMGTIRAGSPTDAERQIQDFLNNHLQEASDAMKKERSIRQAAHDSEDEYTRLGKVCDGSIAVAVAKFGRDEQMASQSSTSVNAARIPPPTRSPARQPFTRY